MKQAYEKAYTLLRRDLHTRQEAGEEFSIEGSIANLYRPQGWATAIREVWDEYAEARSRDDSSLVTLHSLGKLAAYGRALHMTVDVASRDEDPHEIMTDCAIGSWLQYRKLKQADPEPDHSIEWQRPTFDDTCMGIAYAEMGLPLRGSRTPDKNAVRLASRASVAGFRMFAGRIHALPEDFGLMEDGIAPARAADQPAIWMPQGSDIYGYTNGAMITPHDIIMDPSALDARLQAR